jgi:hypothetical protein
MAQREVERGRIFDPTWGWLGAGASLTQHGVGRKRVLAQRWVGRGYVVTQLRIECGCSLAQRGVGHEYAMAQLRVEIKKNITPFRL